MLKQKTFNLLIFLFITKVVCAGDYYQDFENIDNAAEVSWSFKGQVSLSVEEIKENFFPGKKALKAESIDAEFGIGIYPEKNKDSFDLQEKENDRLTFRIKKRKLIGNPFYVELQLFDNKIYKTIPFTIILKNNSRKNEWFLFTLLFKQLPDDFTLSCLEKVQLYFQEKGCYYIDDIRVERDDLTYQDFEIIDYKYWSPDSWGWSFRGTEPLEVAGVSEKVYEGRTAGKITILKPYGGIGIKGAFTNFKNNRQDEWCLDFQEQFNNVIELFIYPERKNKMDLPVIVQFYDTGKFSTDLSKIVCKDFKNLTVDKWNRIIIPFTQLKKSGLDLSKINKIQLLFPEAATYYIDSIKIRGMVPEFETEVGYPDIIRWKEVAGAAKYIVEMKEDEKWKRCAETKKTYFKPSISDKVLFRVRAVNLKGLFSFVSAPGKEKLLFPQYEKNNVKIEETEPAEKKILTVRGKKIFYGATQKEFYPIGINLGSLLCLEPWMTGIGENSGSIFKDEYFWNKILYSCFSETEMKTIKKKFIKNYFNGYDAAIIKDLGFNCVRLPVYYGYFTDQNDEWILNDQGEIDFSILNHLVKTLSDKNLKIIIDLHGAPGAQSREAHSGKENYNQLLQNSEQGRRYRIKTIEFWEGLAANFKDHPDIFAYDLLNEPFGWQDIDLLSLDVLNRLHLDLYKRIRAIDNKHIIMMEGSWDWLTLPDPNKLENVVYQFHLYQWKKSNDFKSQKYFLDKSLKELSVFSDNYQVPLFIGEFSAFNNSFSWEYYLNKFKEYNYGWCIWSYKNKFPGSSWGILTPEQIIQDLPVFDYVEKKHDDFKLVLEKMKKFSTWNNYYINSFYKELIGKYSKTLDCSEKQEINKNNKIANFSEFSINGEKSYEANSSYGALVKLNICAEQEFKLYRWDDGKERIYSKDFVKTLSMGSHTISLAVFDGIKWSMEKKFIVKVRDTESPQIKITSPRSGKYKTTNSIIQKHQIFDINQIMFVKAFIDNQEINPAKEITVKELKDGKHLYRLQTADIHHNYNEKIIEFEIEKFPEFIRKAASINYCLLADEIKRKVFNTSCRYLKKYITRYKEYRKDDDFECSENNASKEIVV